MSFSVAEQIEYLSTAFTLEPGDLLATGTPEGVGAAMDPPRFLKAGDVVRCEIDGIGAIENRVDIGTAMKLKDTYPLYLNNKAAQPNADLEVTDKFTGEVAFRTALATPEIIDQAIAGRGARGRADGAAGELREARRAAALRRALPRAVRRARLCAVRRGGQADPRFRGRGDTPDRYLPHRRRGSDAQLRRGPAARHQPARQGLHGHLAARADRAVQLHFARSTSRSTSPRTRSPRRSRWAARS